MSTTEPTTLESWRGKYENAMETLDSHVGNKFYLPGGITLIILAVALAALTAYGHYQLFQTIDMLAIIPSPEIIVFGGGLYIFMIVVGVHMIRHAIKYQEAHNPTDLRVDDL